MCWMWWKLDDNNGRTWNDNTMIKLTIDGIMTITMELINIKTNGAEAIGMVIITYKIWT